MKQFFKMGFATLALACAGLANAAMIPVSTTFNSSAKLDASNTKSDFSFNLNLLSVGDFTFKAGFDTIDSASLTFNLTDFGNPDPSKNTESYKINFYLNEVYNSGGLFDIIENSNKIQNISVLNNDLLSFSNSGILTGSVVRTGGDFMLQSVVLNAKVLRGLEGSSNEVPEPLSATLFGIGLVGLLAARRKAGA